MKDKTDAKSIRLEQRFLAAASFSPARPALRIKDQEWSYAGLEEAARALAHVLLEESSIEPHRVGILASRSLTAYAGTLGALIAGATFVPLNPRFPVARTAVMIEQADLAALIVDAASAHQLHSLAESTRLPRLVLLPEPTISPLGLDGSTRCVGFEAISSQSPLNALPVGRGSAVAYLLFTSGSTGIPKGVPVTHENALHFFDAMQERCQFADSDRFSQTFDQTFDLSVMDLFACWSVGACLCVPQPIDLVAPQSFVSRERITVWASVPSVISAARKIRLVPGGMPSLRWSMFCGEPLSEENAIAWHEAAPNSRIENLYGPTEVTIACLAHRWTPASSGPLGIVPIGEPLPGLKCLVVDEQLVPVTPGTPGELLVAGPQTVSGYWRDEARTASSFVYPPSRPMERYYRTGDRVTELSNGELAFLGRSDHQIKVLGHRVELGEVEAALRQSPGIVEAVALGWPMHDGIAQGIAAFITPSMNSDAVLGHVRPLLPDYMIPKTIIGLNEMPHNASGKIDRRALQERLSNMSGTHDPKVA